MTELKNEVQMTMEVFCVFKTTLPETYQVPETDIQINSSSTNKDLT